MSGTHRAAVVTGGSRGLGAVIAGVLARRGYDLVVGARESETLERAAASLRAAGARVATVAGDVADAAVRTRLIDEARFFGRLDVLVNNASELGDMRPVAGLDPARLVRLLQVNLVAPTALIHLAAPLLRSSRGLVINISSDAARGGYAGWGAYGASKAGLDLLTRTLDGELRDEGVAAVSVDPGDMRTRMHQEVFPGVDISDRPLPDVTAPFWEWLLDQPRATVGGQRFAAQEEDERWLQRA